MLCKNTCHTKYDAVITSIPVKQLLELFFINIAETFNIGACIRKYASSSVAKHLMLLFIASFLLNIVVMSQPVLADADYKLICWTDRKVYDHDAYDMHTGLVFTVGNSDNPDESVTVFAVLMDSNGSIVNDSNLNFGGRLYDEEVWDHSNTTEHHTILNQTNLNFSNNYFIDSDFSEIGSTGIYQMTAIAAMELGSWLTQEHLLINITINETGVSNGVSYTTHVLFTRMACHHGAKGSNTGHGRHVEDGPTPKSAPCTVCHWGYEHNFGQDMTRSESYEEDILGGNVHTGIYGWNPLSPSGSDEPGIYDHLTGMATGTVSTGDEPWEDVAPGSEWCYSCHYDSANEVWLDYDSGARASCSESDSRAGGGLACHDRTDITNTSLAESESDWYWKLNGSSLTFDHGYDAAGGKLPCEVCHINVHGQQIPNMSVLGTDYHKQLEYQCFPCHNASDYYLNTSYESTSPGVPDSVLHWKGQADCILCHVDENANSDAHWVPLGWEGGRNCTACHKETAAYAPWAVNESVFSESNYIHLHLNSNTTPATVPEVNRICWACHGNITWDGENSIATEEMQPEHMHYLGEDWLENGPVYSDRIATCIDCHYEDDTISPTYQSNYTYQFGAWPNIGHTWYASLITTPAATWCADCHALSNFEVDLYYKNNNAPQRTDNSTVAHYGINQNAWAESKLAADEYCQVCHQNGSTPIPMEQNEDKTRPDHNILPTTPSCTDDACHKNGRLHNDSLVKPVYTSANCTISGCHPTLKNHNGTVTCIDCHLKEQTHIHPIRFVNVNSGHFTTAKGVASRCRDCHDTNYANATQVNETIGIEPMVLPGAHGTGDMDGKLWIRNDETYKGSMSIYSQDVQDTWDKPYWEFEPFVNAWVSDYSKAGGEDILNFTYMQNDAVNESAVIVEESIGGGEIHTYPSIDGYNESVYPYNQNFTLDGGSWTSATTGVGASSLNVSFDGSNGNLSGCLKVGLESDSTTSATGYWNVSFYYNNTDPPVEYAILENLDFKATGNDLSGDSWKFYVDVSKPDGTQTNVYTSSSYTVNPDWQSISDISVSPSFFDVNGWYKFSIRTDITTAGGYMKKQIFYVTYPTVYFDNIDVKIKQNNIYNYDYNFSIENVSRRAHYDLEYSYYVDTEAANMSIYNYTSSDWEHVDNLTKRGAWDARWVMNDNHISSSNQTKIRVYTEEDYSQDTLYIQYMLVHSHNETYYSCEYCHHSNKHYEEALGHVNDFKGNNEPMTLISESNMCASCHYDQYISGNHTYQDMVDAFISFNESVPVEISSNATYGNYTVSLAGASYRDHIAQGDMTPSNYGDSVCIGCHGNSSSMEYVYQFIHSRTSGLDSAGGSDCTSCHYDGSGISPVNHTSIKSGIHGSLNSDAGNSTPVTDEIDKACWACHGDGTENTSHNALIRNCDDCHVNLGSENFSAPQKLEHIPSGFYVASEINTTANCTTCHNNSIDLAHGDTNVKNINASVSHYGTNTSLPDTYGATNSSEGCVYCHLYSTNASTWGDAVDLTVTTYPREHPEITNEECWTCHIDSNISINSFHNVSLNPGWDPECTGCHYSYDYMLNKDSAIAGYFNGSDATNKYVNDTMFGDSVHATLSCTNCHTDSERDEHPPTKGKRKSCESCHVVQSDHTSDTNRHNITSEPLTSVVEAMDCTTCHNSAIYTNSTSNFNRDAAVDCDYCHTYPDKNREDFY